MLKAGRPVMKLLFSRGKRNALRKAEVGSGWIPFNSIRGEIERGLGPPRALRSLRKWATYLIKGILSFFSVHAWKRKRWTKTNKRKRKLIFCPVRAIFHITWCNLDHRRLPAPFLRIWSISWDSLRKYKHWRGKALKCEKTRENKHIHILVQTISYEDFERVRTTGQY